MGRGDGEWACGREKPVAKLLHPHAGLRSEFDWWVGEKKGCDHFRGTLRPLA